MQIQIEHDGACLHRTPEFSASNIIRMLPRHTPLVDPQLEGDWWRVRDGFVHIGMTEPADVAGSAAAQAGTRSGPVAAPLAEADVLSVPYRSQWDSDASDRPSDCGLACVAMLAQWRGIYVAINDLQHAHEDSGITDWNHLVNNFASIELQAGIFSTPMEQLIERLPAICLVWYGGFERSSVQDVNFTGWHWVVLLQQHDDHVVVHDPNFKWGRRNEGHQKRYSAAEWQRTFIPYEFWSAADRVSVALLD